MITLTDQPFDPGAALTAFSRGRTETGAVASFLGLARGEAGGATALELEVYLDFTRREIERRAEAARTRFDEAIRAGALVWAIAEVDVATIDRINILQASRLAMRLAV